MTKEQKELARHNAEALDDMHSLKQHEKLVERFAPEYLKEQLIYVLSRPQSEVKTSRAAYFMWLVHNRASHYDRNHRRD